MEARSKWSLPYIYYDNKSKKFICKAEALTIKYLVISGGGAKGVLLPGVIKALEERCQKSEFQKTYLQNFECIIGSSIGAVTASLLAAGLNSEDIIKSMSEIDFKSLLGKRQGIISKDGLPLENFMRKNIWKSIKEYFQLEWKDIETIKNENENNDMINLLLDEWIRNGDEGKITFAMLEALHKKDPEKFKSLCVTGTKVPEAKTYFFNSINTPNLDIVKACRASAALPVALTSVAIDLESLKGGRYERKKVLPNSPLVEFIDGGYIDNIPVYALNESKLTIKSNLEFLAIVFDEADEVLGQTPFFNERNPQNALFNPSPMQAFVRDKVAKKYHGLSTDKRNTEEKTRGLEEVRVDFSQRHIPLKADLKTTDFDKAKLHEKEYHNLGYDLACSYLDNHLDEILIFSEDTLSDLISALPDYLRCDRRVLDQLQDEELTSELLSRDKEASEMVASEMKAGESLLQLVEEVKRELNEIKGGKRCDKLDKLNRTYYEVITSDLEDNLKNQLSHEEKQKNMVEILMHHYYHAKENRLDKFADKIKEILEEKFSDIINQENISFSNEANRPSKK